MTSLHEIGLKHGTDKATFHGYLDFYAEHLPGRDFDGNLLEIGVMDGASLKMWREYYPEAVIVGIDNARPIKINGCYVYLLDATVPTDLEALAYFSGFDVIIDDGSHMTADQQTTFGLLWPELKPGGTYIIEDLHTSFMINYVNSEQTTVEWLLSEEFMINYEPADLLSFQDFHGDPDDFIERHGFPTDRNLWRGGSNAASMTTMIKKKMIMERPRFSGDDGVVGENQGSPKIFTGSEVDHVDHEVHLYSLPCGELGPSLSRCHLRFSHLGGHVFRGDHV